MEELASDRLREPARYCVSLQPILGKAVVNRDIASRTCGRLSSANLDMLSGSGIYTLDGFLQSAFTGLGDKDPMVERRNRALETTAMADSGGFQISTGAKKCSEPVRLQLLRYCEQFACAPILDGPTTSINNPRSFLRTERECLEFTIEGGIYAISNRILGKTQMMNVIQGRNYRQAIQWYDEVKFLNTPQHFGDRALEGWCFAGVTRGYFALVLNLLVRMRDDNLIRQGGRFHFLGAGELKLRCGFDAIQEALRETVDKDILISHDTATPFQSAGERKEAFGAPRISPRGANFTYRRMPVGVDFVGSDDPWPVSSPFADRLTVGDLNFHAVGRQTPWDEVSYALLAAHNTWVKNQAFLEMHRRLRLPLGQALALLPARVIELADVIREILRAENPMGLIQQHHRLLDRFAAGTKNHDLIDANVGIDP